MTDTELDRILRSADPAAARPAPAPGPLPHRPVAVPVPRRTGWLPVASAAAVVAVVGAAVALLPSWDRGDGIQAGAPGRPVPSAAGPSGSGESSAAAKPERPHTASAGAEFARARRLLGTLQDAVPDRYTLPTGPIGNAATPPAGPAGALPEASFQAVRDEEPYEAYTGYVYDAESVVRDGPRAGTVRARVYEGIPDLAPCAVADLAAWNPGTCSVVATPAGPVAVVRATGGDGSDPRETQWAVHRRADGTTVLVAQGPGVLDAAVPPLTRPVWTQARLVALATAPAFAAG